MEEFNSNTKREKGSKFFFFSSLRLKLNGRKVTTGPGDKFTQAKAQELGVAPEERRACPPQAQRQALSMPLFSLEESPSHQGKPNTTPTQFTLLLSNLVVIQEQNHLIHTAY